MSKQHVERCFDMLPVAVRHVASTCCWCGRGLNHTISHNAQRGERAKNLTRLDNKSIPDFRNWPRAGRGDDEGDEPTGEWKCNRLTDFFIIFRTFLNKIASKIDRQVYANFSFGGNAPEPQSPAPFYYGLGPWTTMEALPWNSRHPHWQLLEVCSFRRSGNIEGFPELKSRSCEFCLWFCIFLSSSPYSLSAHQISCL